MREAPSELSLEGGQELGVGLGLYQPLQHPLRGLGGIAGGADHERDHPPHQPDLGESGLVEEKLLAPGAAAVDIYGGEDTPFLQPAFQV